MASQSLNLLSCTNTELVFLEALKKCFVHLSSKITFFGKKTQTHENLSQVFLEAIKKFYCALKPLK